MPNYKNQTKPLEYFLDDKPVWMSLEAVRTLVKGYLETDETPNLMYKRLAYTAASYYPNGLEGVSRLELERDFYHILINGYLSPATPVASNFGAAGSGLPVSCFAPKPANNIYGIFTTARELALLSKHGGGLGVNLSDLIGSSRVTEWAQVYDKVANKVNQGGTRRGAMAAYLDINHPDIDVFLNSIDVLDGDHREKLDSKIAVMIDDNFFFGLRNQQKREVQLWDRILKLRMKYGFPYIQFKGNSERQDPEWYTDKGLQSGSSQLCSEIFLHHDSEHTYSCVLSSLNAARWFEWKNWAGETAFSVPELAIFFLDAVNEEFIQKGSKIKGLENAVRGAVKGRPLGLGVLGLHSLYMSQNMPFESEAAASLNTQLFKYINEETTNATRILAEELGECLWCEGYGRRNTHLVAVAPTTSNSILCNAGSPGIEPIIANYFVMKGAKVTTERKNPYLVALLDKLGHNYGAVWASIRQRNGSVQHLEFLSEEQKEVFKTAFEINPHAIIDQAAERQLYIDQGQSLNLFFRPEDSAQLISDVHLSAYDKNLKSLYYVRSESVLQSVNGSEDINYVHMKTREDCPYCIKAKQLLESKGIRYTTEYKPTGRVPEIWVSGEVLSNGYESLVKRFLGSTIEAPEADCIACEG